MFSALSDGKISQKLIFMEGLSEKKGSQKTVDLGGEYRNKRLLTAHYGRQTLPAGVPRAHCPATKQLQVDGLTQKKRWPSQSCSDM